MNDVTVLKTTAPNTAFNAFPLNESFLTSVLQKKKKKENEGKP